MQLGVVAVNPTARVFFAAWPPREVQRALGDIAQAQGECGGRAVPAHDIHLTLLFIGDVPRDRVGALDALGATISARPFHLVVDRLEYWRHNRILWAGVEQCPHELTALVERLRLPAAAAGYRIERRPYIPHITLRREARRAPASSEVRLDWPVADFALVESAPRERGRVYEVLRRWPLSK